jgi:type I restriction enzyme, R subunit
MPTDGNGAEWLTRKLRIDTRMQAFNPSWQCIPWQAGLGISNLNCPAVMEFPTGNVAVSSNEYQRTL